MTNQTFYHFDRRNSITINSQKIFRNDNNKPTRFYFDLGVDVKAKEDFGNELLTKVNDFPFDNNLSLDFLDDLVARFKENENQIVQKVIFELLFEETRRKTFRNLPSRMKSLFVVESMASLEYWKKSLPGEGTAYKLTPIEIMSKHEADSKWFESCSIDNIETAKQYAENYWNGIKSADPKIEWLITGKFNCEKL